MALIYKLKDYHSFINSVYKGRVYPQRGGQLQHWLNKTDNVGKWYKVGKVGVRALYVIIM